MDTITLRTKQDLDIFINPRRQTILRCLRIAGEPLTPKQISDRIGISASSVQYHMQKLFSIGLVELSHTEMIHGITARYYRLTPKNVSVGMMLDENREQRIAVMQSTMSQTFAGYTDYCANVYPNIGPDEPYGDMYTAVVHMEPQHVKALYEQTAAFIERHKLKTERSTAWEFTMLVYPVSANEND